jgi:hypothetical protein
VDERERQIAENEARFRALNEGIEHAKSALPEATFEFVCECGRDDCTERIQLTSDEYEHVRERGNRFVLKPGHELEEVEQVIERHELYFVVEKDPGEPSELVERRDARH